MLACIYAVQAKPACCVCILSGTTRGPIFFVQCKQTYMQCRQNQHVFQMVCVHTFRYDTWTYLCVCTCKQTYMQCRQNQYAHVCILSNGVCANFQVRHVDLPGAELFRKLLQLREDQVSKPVRVWVFVCMRVCICGCLSVWVCVLVWVFDCACLCVHVCACQCVCVCVCA